MRSLVEQLLGGSQFVPDWTGNGCQIALIYPTGTASSGKPPRHFGYHIDGIPTDGNGLDKSKLHPFSLLVGVYLNDLTVERSGQLILYPGSHVKHAQHFASQGSAQSLLKAQEGGFKMPLDFQNPVPLLVSAGTVVVSHYLTAHGIWENCSHQIRYALYFRVTSTAMDRERVYLDPFENFPGLK